MAYTISSSDIAQVHVEGQETILRGSATENKQVFDAFPLMIVGKFNDFVNHAESQYSAQIDAATIALYRDLGWTPD